MSATGYVIEQEFEGDGEASAITKAAAWLVLQGSSVEDITITGQSEKVFLYYKMKTPKASATGPGTGSITTVDPSRFTFTNGEQT